MSEWVRSICPECSAGKHWNCNGTGGIDEDNNLLACYCTEEGHSDDASQRSVELFTIEANRQGYKAGITAGLVPTKAPENDPGIWGEAFPELTGDNSRGPRPKPDVDVIKDLFDLEIKNDAGDWVPAVPWFIKSRLGFKQCLCGKWRFGKWRYQEHYAYGHILGMDE